MKHLILPIITVFAVGCTATRDAEVADVVEVPMDVSSGRPMVEIMINGQGPFEFIVDTGMPEGGMINADIIDALKLESTGQREINSPLGGPPVPSDLYQAETISIGAAVSHDVTLDHIQGDVTASLGAGVIGPSLFDEGLVTFDFERNVLRIGGETPEGVTWIGFGESAPILDGVVSIQGVDMPAHIDTGAPGLLTLPSEYTEQLELDGPLQVIGRGRTIDKEFEITRAPLNTNATIGDAIIPLENVMFGPFPVVNLGTGGLRGLVLTIDWLNERYAIVGEATPVEMQPRQRRRSSE